MPEASRGPLEYLKSKKHFNAIVGILFIFSGIDLIVVGQKDIWVHYVGILLLVLGVAYLLFFFLPYLRSEYKEGRETLAGRLLSLMTYRGKLQVLFPVFGLVLIALDLVYNLVLSSTPSLLTFDTLILLFGFWLVFHNFVPKRFSRERDFVFMFLFFLVLILVLPLLLVRISVGDYSESVNIYSANLLVPPVVALLRLFGVPILDVDGIWMHMGLKGGGSVWIGITTECSGILSFGIFAAAFMAFVLIEFERFSWRAGALMGLGILASYIANILRMTVIMLVGYSYDSTDLQNMLFAHANAGWIIFLLWISLFWALMYRFLMRDGGHAEAKPEGTAKAKKGVRCGVCSDILKLDIPGYRCECGRFYHVHCLEGMEKCPECGRAIRTGARDAAAGEARLSPS